MTRIFIALGSNINAEQNLTDAAALLTSRLPGIRFSSVYRTAPVAYEDQDDFLNAVATAETDASPMQVHDMLQTIESALGKAPPFKNGPRTIDLDLLLFGDLHLPIPPTEQSYQHLVIPHPRMHTRRFVLQPLLDLVDGSEMHPVIGRTWNDLLDALPEERVVPTALDL